LCSGRSGCSTVTGIGWGQSSSNEPEIPNCKSPVVVVSHGMQTDPVLNYGNRMALTLWEMTWEQLIETPSRLTAEPVNRAEREWMLEQARVRGYLDTYKGVRISRSGRRFLVEGAIVWNVLDAHRQQIGQAATFAHWTWLS
jgi:hypothetical protein